MEEIWMPVKNFPGYLISNMGRLKSFKRNKVRILKPLKGKYLHYSLQYGTKYKHCSIHRLIAIHFIVNPENKPEVNHKDGNKQNNNIYNLEWATICENRQHAYRTGLQKSGQRKLTISQIKEIRIKHPIHTILQLSREYNVHSKTIYDILHNVNYKNII